MKKIIKTILVMTLVFAFTTNTVQAAGYDSIKRKFCGYGVSVSKESDKKIGKEYTVGELVNRGSKSIKVTDEFVAKKSITFSAKCAASITGSIGITDGVASTSLGEEISSEYSFSTNFVYSYTKSLTKKVPKKSTYTIKVQPKGDELKVYYKRYAVLFEIGKGSGTIYVPKYYSFIAE